MPPEKALKLLEDGLSRLLEDAERLRQRLSLQCAPGLLIERSAELKALLGKLKSPWLGANFDPGVADVSGEDPCRAIRALKGRIFIVHLADIRAHKHYRRVPGEGDLDFRAIFRQLDAIGYAGPLTWDLHTYGEAPNDACRRTFEYLRKMVGPGARRAAR
jgi:protein FrlC